MANDKDPPKQQTIGDVAPPKTTATPPAQEPADPLPATDSTALVTTTPKPVRKKSGTFADPVEASENILGAIEKGYHVITPAPTVSRLPAGCEISIVRLDFTLKDDAHDVGGGKYSLLKHALLAIGAAVGVSWDHERSGRIDDGSHPHYCHWRAVGAWRALDGTPLPIGANKEMDLRDGSDQAEKIITSNKSGRQAGEKQLRETRAVIMAHAETKAQLRAIRTLPGIRSFTPQEFQKAFIIVRLTFTGYSRDREQQNRFQDKIADSMLGGSRALFGGVPSGASEMRALASTGHAPPPIEIGDAGGDRDDDDPPSRPSPRTAPAERSTSRTESIAGPVCGFGKNKGIPLADLENKDLHWLEDTLAQNVDDPTKARFRGKNEHDLRVVRGEIERRLGGATNTTTKAAPKSEPEDDGY